MSRSSGGGGGGGGSYEITKDQGGSAVAKAAYKVGKAVAKAAGKAVGNAKVSSKELEVDMVSVRNLGYGPVSAEYLNELVASGKVVEYESGGKLKYRRAAELSDAEKKKYENLYKSQ